MSRDNDRHDGGECVGNTETEALQSVPKRSAYDLEACLNCGSPLPGRRRRGSARRCCSPRCRKLAWLGRIQSVPGKAGQLAKKRERFGLTDRAAAMVGISGRAMRRGLEMLRLLEGAYGPENAMDVFRELEKSGKKIHTLLKEEKERHERLVIDYVLGRRAAKGLMAERREGIE